MPETMKPDVTSCKNRKLSEYATKQLEYNRKKQQELEKRYEEIVKQKKPM
ncbi:hypothetical protein [Shouchella shacheensis]|nr:hypothetical protein [Shouchella shacheensis]